MLERVESNIVEPSKQEDLTSNMDITPTDIGDIGIRAWWERWWRWRWWLWKLWCNEFTDSLAGGSILGAWTRGKTKHMWYELVTFSAFENILNIPNLHSYMILYFFECVIWGWFAQTCCQTTFFWLLSIHSCTLPNSHHVLDEVLGFLWNKVPLEMWWLGTVQFNTS